MVAETQSQPTDLLTALVVGDQEAFANLVRQYQDRLYAFALRYTGRREDAEEVVQDTFVKAYRALCGRLTPERVLSLSLTPWLYRITLNTARNHLRRRQISTTSLPGGDPERDGEMGDLPGDEAGPEESAEAAATRKAIVAELRRLPDRYRAAVVLRFVEGLTYAEIAAITGQPVGTVKSNVHRGLLRMRPGLASWWHTEEGEVSNGLP